MVFQGYVTIPEVVLEQAYDRREQFVKDIFRDFIRTREGLRDLQLNSGTYVINRSEMYGGNTFEVIAIFRWG